MLKKCTSAATFLFTFLMCFASSQFLDAGFIVKPTTGNWLQKWTSTENGNLSAAEVAAAVGTSATLTELYKASPTSSTDGIGIEVGLPFDGSYATNYSQPGGLADGWSAFDITYGGGLRLNREKLYLVVKDGNEPQCIFDISNWDRTTVINGSEFWLNTQGAISHLHIFGNATIPPPLADTVPEPSIVVLFGLGMISLIGNSVYRRRKLA